MIYRRWYSFPWVACKFRPHPKVSDAWDSRWLPAVGSHIIVLFRMPYYG